MVRSSPKNRFQVKPASIRVGFVGFVKRLWAAGKQKKIVHDLLTTHEDGSELEDEKVCVTTKYFPLL